MSDDQLVLKFVAITSASAYLAQQYLSRNDNDLTAAIEDYYASNDESSAPPLRQSPDRSRGGVRTLRDLDDDEPEENPNQNFFTGGEKSALQVENPDKKKKDKEPSLIERIFQRAREQMDEPDDRESARGEEVPETFSGTGFKLGDTTLPLEPVGDTSKRARKPEKVTREITFWRQGFTVGDGPLQRYDDPENENVLQELKQGRVPVSVLGVEFGQDVDVSVLKKTDEDYAPPKRKLGGFGGSGQRLGSPVPGETSGPVSPASPSEEPVEASKPKPDQGDGDSPVQIRFANGKRAAHKFNSSDPVLRVYDFVRTHENNDGRPFTLNHAFPVKPIEESVEVTVEDAKLKNSVVVQRWK